MPRATQQCWRQGVSFDVVRSTWSGVVSARRFSGGCNGQKSSRNRTVGVGVANFSKVF